MNTNQEKIKETILLLQEIRIWQDEWFPNANHQARRIKDRLIDALAIIKALLEEMQND